MTDSQRKRTLAPGPLTGLVMLVVAASFGCWEQIDGGEWFPQMKRQPAVQAYEELNWNGRIEGMTPPEGTVPVGYSGIPDLKAMTLPQQDAVENPVSVSYESVKNGEKLFGQYCATCHGPLGMGDGPVAAKAPWAPNNYGPFQAILPLNGPMSIANAYSDGHIYTTISLGRGRMPNYSRISAMERWDIVNFIREINGRGLGK